MKVVIVASTHWDREWYRTFPEFRVRLVELFNRLLPMLENGDLSHYSFDGQAVVLDDYLSVSPKNSERIKKLVRENKLSFGPLYILADEFLSGGEAIIRNFLVGKELCDEIGGRCDAGYIPDNFGHVSQLPQILNGVNLDTAMFFRGLDLSTVGNKEFFWETADGSKVTCEYMILGYWSLKSWGRMEENTLEHFDRVVKTLSGASALDCSLMVNGSDQLLQDPLLMQKVEEVKSLHPNIEISVGSFADYAKILSENSASSPDKIKTITGELRDFRYGPDPTAVTSTRNIIKSKLFLALRQTVRYTEPLMALVTAGGGDGYSCILDNAWKDILKSLAHDACSGCSSDEVMTDVEGYLTHALQSVERLYDITMEKIFAARGNENSLLIFNPALRPYSGVIETTIIFDDDKVRDFRLFDDKGNDVPWEYIDNYTDVITREFPYNSKEKIYRSCFKVRFFADNLKPMVITSYTIEPSAIREMREKEFYNRQINSTPMIENEFYSITADQNAGFTVKVKHNNKVYSAQGSLVSRGEAGDEYNHVSPMADVHCFSILSGVSMVKNSPLSSSLIIHGRIDVPKMAKNDFLSRDELFVSCNYSSVVTLKKDSATIEVITEFENNASDHILFAKFPTEFIDADDFSNMAFDEVTRSNDIFPFREGLKSTQSLLSPIEDYAGLRSGDSNLIVTTKGLYEYHTKASNEGTDLYLTLLRSSSYIFHGLPLTYQDGQHSTTPIVETIGSKELGTKRLEYALMLDHQDYMDAAQQYRYPPKVFGGMQISPNTDAEDRIPDATSISVEDKRISFSALKTNRDESGLILRLYNNSSEAFEFKLGITLKIKGLSRCNMLEEPLQTLGFTDGECNLSAKPKEIITLKLDI